VKKYKQLSANTVTFISCRHESGRCHTLPLFLQTHPIVWIIYTIQKVNSALSVHKDWVCKTKNFIIGEWEWLSRRLLVLVCRKPEFKSWYRQKFPLSFKCYYISFALKVDQKYIPLWGGVLVSFHRILEEEDPYLHESIIVKYFTTQMNWSPWMTPSLKQQIWNISLCYFH